MEMNVVFVFWLVACLVSPLDCVDVCWVLLFTHHCAIQCVSSKGGLGATRCHLMPGNVIIILQKYQPCLWQMVWAETPVGVILPCAVWVKLRICRWSFRSGIIKLKKCFWKSHHVSWHTSFEVEILWPPLPLNDLQVWFSGESPEVGVCVGQQRWRFGIRTGSKYVTDTCILVLTVCGGGGLALCRTLGHLN